MRTFGKWLGRALLMLLLAAVAVYFLKREEITRVLAVNSLFSEEKIVSNFSNMDQLFLHTAIPLPDTPPSPLPQGTPLAMPEGFDTWLTERDVTSVVVLKDGAIVHESYHQGTQAEDLKISWSVAKSFLSSLMGILVSEGRIDISEPVTTYAPLLVGTAYDGVTVKDVLQMSSGVTFDEDYLDFYSDINRMGRVVALGGTLDGFTAGLTERFVDPGVQFQYVSIDTHVLGMVIRGATGQSISELLGARIISKLGFEATPYYLTDGEGVAFVLGGLNIRTRDYARFGQMVLQNGRYNGAQVVPQAWLDAATVPSANTAPDKLHYGYQWWMPKDPRPGEFFAIGVYGQYIYINRPAGVVIAVNSADRRFKQRGVTDGNIALFRAISTAAQ